jgi:transcriptional regulator
VKQDKSAATLLKGTVDLLILRTLELEPRHGVGIADRVYETTAGAFAIGPGSLFPALHRMEDRGLIRGDWRETDEGRRAKFYVLTAAGRRHLDREKQAWARTVVAMQQVLG